MTTELGKEAARLLGETLEREEPLQMGGLSQVVALRFASGAEAIAKNGPAPRIEAEMLQAIRAAGAPAPEVLAVSEAALVLERLPEGGSLSERGAGAFGQALARLHGAAGARYGWRENYAFGAVPIRNAHMDDWPAFWAENRLLSEAERLPSRLSHRLEALASKLDEILPRKPTPGLCHGDLWSGNVLLHEGGVAGVIDPAAYYGHGELDLAMLALFGSIHPTTQEAYGALEPGWRERRAVYQLWPAIVHFRLFGEGYRQMIESLLDASR